MIAVHRSHSSTLVAASAILLAAAFARVHAEDRAADASLDGQEMLALPVQVLDAAGEPVAGAIVVPWALRCSQGHGQWRPEGFGNGEPPQGATDADGRASVPFPKFAVLDERVLTTEVTLSIDHPDFAYIMYEFVPIPRKETGDHRITLQQGARVELQPLLAGQPADGDGLFALWSDGRSWTPGARPRVDADGVFHIPPMPAGAGQALLVRLDGERATHFSPLIDLDLSASPTLRQSVELSPAATLRGQLSDNVPRPIVNGRLIARTLPRDLERENVLWTTWAPIAADGTWEIPSWPADEAVQIIALCDGYYAASGDAPTEVNNPRVPNRWVNDALLSFQSLADRLERAADAKPADASPESSGLDAAAHLARLASTVGRPDMFLRPQVFRPAAFERSLTLDMVPAVRCEIEVVDAAGAPLAGAKLYSNPNVGWWNYGSQIYCTPLARGERLLVHRDYDASVEKNRYPQPYFAVTDAAGRAVMELPIGHESLYAEHDAYELPIIQGRREQSVTLLAGETAHARLVLQPKGTEHLGEWDKLAGVLFGCTGEECRRLLEDEGFAARMATVRIQLAAAKNPRDPKLLASAYAEMAAAFKEIDDQQEANRWRRKAAEQAERLADEAAPATP
jgi:hypothetical protein